MSKYVDVIIIQPENLNESWAAFRTPNNQDYINQVLQEMLEPMMGIICWLIRQVGEASISFSLGSHIAGSVRSTRVGLTHLGCDPPRHCPKNWRYPNRTTRPTNPALEAADKDSIKSLAFRAHPELPISNEPDHISGHVNGRNQTVRSKAAATLVNPMTCSADPTLPRPMKTPCEIHKGLSSFSHILCLLHS